MGRSAHCALRLLNAPFRRSTAPARVETCNFLNTVATWLRTVASAIERLAAICAVVIPSASNSRTSHWRCVSSTPRAWSARAKAGSLALVTKLLDQSRDEPPRESGLTGEHPAQRARHPFGVHLVGQETHRAGVECAEGIVEVCALARDDDGGLRQPPPDLAGREDAAFLDVDREQA